METLAFVPRPQNGESFDSWLTRLAAQYDMEPRHLLRALALDVGWQTCLDPEIDVSARMRRVFEHYCELGPAELPDVDPEWCLAPPYRTSVCPVCWLEDLEQGTAPYSRSSWVKPTYLICERHNCPLVDVSGRDLDPTIFVKFYSVLELDAGARNVVARFRIIQGFLDEVDNPELLASARYGMLCDLLTFVGTNFIERPEWGAAIHMVDMLKIRYWRLPWDILLSHPIARPGPVYRNAISTVDLCHVPTAGYRRILLLAAFLALPGALNTRHLIHRDCFRDKAIDWIRNRRDGWTADEVSLLMPIAQRVAL